MKGRPYLRATRLNIKKYYKCWCYHSLYLRELTRSLEKTRLQAKQDILDRNFAFLKKHGLMKVSEKSTGDGNWKITLTFNESKVRFTTDEALCALCGLYSYYTGPGRPYAEDAFVKRNKGIVVVKQYGGWDI